jgi:hypothetical protein
MLQTCKTLVFTQTELRHDRIGLVCASQFLMNIGLQSVVVPST